MEYLITEKELDLLKAGHIVKLAYIGRKDHLAKISDNFIKMIPAGSEDTPQKATETPEPIKTG